jgi:hypothetical protein
MLTHAKKRCHPLLALLFTMAFAPGCAVYTVEKSHLETKLKPSSTAVNHTGLGLNKLLALYKNQYNNHVDTILCLDRIGKTKAKRLSYDSKVTVITTDNRTIRFYAKTLYIWKDEFLVGERTVPSLRGVNCFTVKLKDIARIEVRG